MKFGVWFFYNPIQVTDFIETWSALYGGLGGDTYIDALDNIRLMKPTRVGTTEGAPDSLLHVSGGDLYVAPDSGYTFDNFSTDEDLYVFGNLEVDGTIFGT